MNSKYRNVCDIFIKWTLNAIVAPSIINVNINQIIEKLGYREYHLQANV